MMLHVDVSSYTKLFISLLNLESRFHKYFRRREYKINFVQVLNRDSFHERLWDLPLSSCYGYNISRLTLLYPNFPCVSAGELTKRRIFFEMNDTRLLVTKVLVMIQMQASFFRWSHLSWLHCWHENAPTIDILGRLGSLSPLTLRLFVCWFPLLYLFNAPWANNGYFWLLILR